MQNGNGTADIIRELGLNWVEHYSAGAWWDQPEQAERFLGEIPAIVQQFSACGVLLFQAGADPHQNDPLGGWLTTAQLRRRDCEVLLACKSMGLPIAWNLVGGYQASLLRMPDIHDYRMLECLSVFARDDKTERLSWFT